jgi:tRNA dimethylallyltransferase
MGNKKLISVSGPTAIGKTKLSIKLAKALKTEIISFDSRQFYEEMCIGTAVPSKIELNEVKHHFIQHRSIIHPYTVYDFSLDANKLIKKLFKLFDNIILVGGSYMFLKSIIYGIDEMPKIPIEIRNKLNENLKINGIEFLQSALHTKDPEYYEIVDLNNPRRLIRALEIIEFTKKSYTSFLTKNKEKKFNHYSIAINTDRSNLYKIINKRVDMMIDSGLINEAKKLYTYKNFNALNTVGYREIFNYFNNKCSKDFAINEIKKNTRRFAKKQITWLKNSDENHHWIDIDYNLDVILKKIK